MGKQEDQRNQELFEKAYALMNETIVDGNCGEQCDYHCCRHSDGKGQRMGMYLLPYEFECMQQKQAKSFEVHSCKQYDMPPGIKKMFYLYCDEAEGCLREMRPVQCRTYPFEPHLENGQLTLVIEKNQIHACPLLNSLSTWRPAFIKGIYAGWLELIKIPKIHHFIEMESLDRLESNNIMKQHDGNQWL